MAYFECVIHGVQKVRCKYSVVWSTTICISSMTWDLWSSVHYPTGIPTIDHLKNYYQNLNSIGIFWNEVYEALCTIQLLTTTRIITKTWIPSAYFKIKYQGWHRKGERGSVPIQQFIDQGAPSQFFLVQDSKYQKLPKVGWSIQILFWTFSDDY